MVVVPRGLGLVAAFAVLGTARYLVYKYNTKKDVGNSRKDAMDQRSSSRSSQITWPSKFGNEVQVHQLNESLFELYMPSSKPSLQVLFFHGFQLGDHEDPHLSTWKSGDGSIWPGTWLREEFPNAHILSIAYNSCLTKSKEDGSMDLFVIAENLMADLLEAKIGQDRRCPIVLVGHSFGGLVIKELCLQARKKGSSEHNRFLENVKGIFFYSTPHGGIRPEILESLSKSKSLLLKNVRLLSTSTSRLNDDFEKLHEFYRDWHIAGVGEGCPTELGQFPAFMVVEEASSRYHGHDFVIVSYANHVTISRPNKKTSTSFSTLKRFIDEVCKNPKVSGAIHHTQGLPDFSSGLEKRVQGLKKMLEKGTSQATVLGIVGMGGIRKTTLAKRLFNEISVEFEYTCFVDNVKGIAIHNLTDCTLTQFHHDGVKVERMQWVHLKDKRTLIVMDDVDSEDQLQKLPKLHDFGGNSHLIITSRVHNVCNGFSKCPLYDVGFLDDDEAKELLCQHAFGLDKIPKYLMEKDHRLGGCVDGLVQKCQGLPLTLEVMGRYLRRHNSNVGFWNQTIRKLGEAKSVDGIENDRVWASLKVSYDDLAREEKEMYIEAGTCFFEQPLEEALAAWSGSNGSVEITWENLIRRSLVKVIDGEIWVHEHLRDLAKKVSGLNKVSIYDVNAVTRLDSRAVILMKSEIDWSRGWSTDDRVEDVWFEAGVTKIEDRSGLALDMTRSELFCNYKRRTSTVELESLEHMENLKYLYLDEVMPEGLSKNFPRNLSLLKWTLPYGLGNPELPGISWKEMRKLSVLELRGWKVPTEFPEALGHLTNLRFLGLSGLVDVDFLPEKFSNLSCLQQLKLAYLSLTTLPNSFGNLGALEYLEISHLEILELPGSFGGLHSLIRLTIWNCRTLGSLPESFGHLSSLKELVIRGCRSLEILPESFGKLSSLEELTVKGCSRFQRLPDNLGELKSLKKLEIDGASNLEALPNSFGKLSLLTHLELLNCPSLEELPESVGKLSSLEEFTVKGCSRVQRLPDNFGELKSLKKLEIDGTSNLEALLNSFGKLSSLTHVKLLNCPSLDELPESVGKLSSLEELTVKGCSRFQRLPDNFGELKSLKKLEIDGASILEALSNSFGKLSSLIHLKLLNCPSLDELPESVGKLSSLEELTVKGCSRLQRLPDNFGELKSVKKLEIDGALNLEALTNSFGKLSSLTHLELLNCPSLEELPASFGQLISLQTLTIEAAHHLQKLCDNFGNLYALTCVKLSDCPKLENLPLTFGLLHGLKELELSYCSHLQRLPDTFGQLAALTRLVVRETDHLEELCGNFELLSGLKELELDTYSPFQKLLNTPGQLLALEKLKLTIQKAEHLADLCDNVELRSTVKVLVLNLTEIKRLPNNLGQFTTLTKLSIMRADHLEELPDSIASISSLREIRLYQCARLKSLPDNLGKPLSPELALSREDSVSPSPVKSEGSKASMPKALNGVLHQRVRCDGCNMKPIEGTRFKSTEKDNYDLCSNCFEEADDQADYYRINQPVNRNGLRVYITKCPFLAKSVLARLGWMEHSGECYIPYV